jgi:hypothetical protein
MCSQDIGLPVLENQHSILDRPSPGSLDEEHNWNLDKLWLGLKIRVPVRLSVCNVPTPDLGVVKYATVLRPLHPTSSGVVGPRGDKRQATTTSVVEVCRRWTSFCLVCLARYLWTRAGCCFFFKSMTPIFVSMSVSRYYCFLYRLCNYAQHVLWHRRLLQFNFVSSAVSPLSFGIFKIQGYQFLSFP